MGVSPSAAAALGGDIRGVVRHVGEDAPGLSLPDEGASGHCDDQVLSAFSKAAPGPARMTVLSLVFALVSKVRKGRKIIVRGKNNVASLAAVTPVRTAGSDVFLTVKADRAVTSVASLDFDFSNIDKHNSHFLSNQ